MPIKNLKNLIKHKNVTYIIDYSVNNKRIKKSLSTINYKTASNKADEVLPSVKGLNTFSYVVTATAKTKQIYSTNEIFIKDAWKPFELYFKRIIT